MSVAFRNRSCEKTRTGHDPEREHVRRFAAVGSGSVRISPNAHARSRYPHHTRAKRRPAFPDRGAAPSDRIDLARANVTDMRPDERAARLLRRPENRLRHVPVPEADRDLRLYEMERVEAQGTRVEVYPLQSQREAKMHAERRAGSSGALWSAALRAHPGGESRRVRAPSTPLCLDAPVGVWRNWGSVRYLSGGLAFFPKAVLLGGANGERGGRSRACALASIRRQSRG